MTFATSAYHRFGHVPSISTSKVMLVVMLLALVTAVTVFAGPINVPPQLTIDQANHKPTLKTVFLSSKYEPTGIGGSNSETASHQVRALSNLAPAVNHRIEADDITDDAKPPKPSYMPVFTVFSISALITLMLMLHILYTEWKNKQALATSDPTGFANMASTSLRVSNDMIPMTLKRELSVPTSRLQLHEDTLIQLNSPVPNSRQQESKPQGLIAFESVSN